MCNVPTTPKHLGVAEVARQLGVPPTRVSMLLYRDHADDARFPLVGGRRLIPEDALPAIAAELRERGVDVPDAEGDR